MFELGPTESRLPSSSVWMRGLIVLAVLTATVWTHTSAVLADDNFEASLAAAAKRGVPSLLKIEADWCVDCRAFDADLKSSSEFAGSVASQVQLISIDAEKGFGIRLAESYRVDKYPTFVLADEAGRTMDRWFGYYSEESFSERLSEALADPLPVGRRRQQFALNPTESDAIKLSKIAMAEGYFGEAIAFARQAGRLGGHEDNPHSEMIMRSMLLGAYERVFDVSQVVAEALPMLAASELDEHKRIRLTWAIARLGAYFDDDEVAHEYFRRSIEDSEDSDHPKVIRARAQILPSYALLVEGDAELALKYLEKSLPEGWQEDAHQLNVVAWWCFKNQKHIDDEQLAEAERLARRGVELAAPGIPKANVLDTLAEICNLRGSCEQAVELIREAMEEAPQNQYFQEQAVRFEKILAKK